MYGILSPAGVQARKEHKTERRRKKVNTYKARLRERDADRQALRRELYRRVFGL